MFLAANCLVSFLWGCAEDSPEIAKLIGKRYTGKAFTLQQQ